jgi:hypothetical protein
LFGVGHARRRSNVGEGDPGQGRANRPTADLGLDLRRWTVGHNAASRHQDDAVGVGVGLFEVVGGEDNRLAPSRHGAHRLPKVAAALDVERRRGLVEH